MKNVVKTTGVLSWINLCVGCLLVFCGVLMGIASGNLLNILIFVLLPSAIILHSYASLQLKKSVMNPDIPLGSQTPIGIRFMGYIMLFFSFFNIYSSVSILLHAQEFVREIKLPPGSPKINLTGVIRAGCTIALLFSVSFAVNAILNLRLLRWYMSQPKE
ncbi:MAG TPA: hypothetical protein VMH01_00940 [Puia sp.]|nr:hypothetical protein [Puia sp.]